MKSNEAKTGTMKVLDGITHREAEVIGEAGTEGEALEVLRRHYAGTGEDRLYGITRVEVPAEIDWRGEAWGPRLRGIN